MVPSVTEGSFNEQSDIMGSTLVCSLTELKTRNIKLNCK